MLKPDFQAFSTRDRGYLHHHRLLVTKVKYLPPCIETKPKTSSRDIRRESCQRLLQLPSEINLYSLFKLRKQEI